MDKPFEVGVSTLQAGTAGCVQSISRENHMRIRTLHVSVLSAGLLFAGFTMTASAADDTPAPQAKGEKAAGGDSTQQFPLLKRFRSVVDELKLSDDQKAKVDKAFEEAQSQIKKVRDSAESGDQQATAQKLREAYTTLRENVSAALTDEQKEQFKEKLQSMFRAGGAGGGDITRLRSALEKLNLSDDQKTKVKELLEDTQTKAKDLREKAQGGDQDARDKLRTLVQDARQKLGDILTKDEMEKLKELMQQSAPGRDQPNAPKPERDSK
jgi:Spy/CpxP family protein refolding chaperone